MTITSLTATAVRIPVKRAHPDLHAVAGQAGLRAVSLRREGDDDGGHGLHLRRDDRRDGGRARRCRELLAPVLLGRDDEDIVGAWDAMYQERCCSGAAGPSLRAMSAVDIALWDLAAKRVDVPLAVLLGGGARPSLPTPRAGTTSPVQGAGRRRSTRRSRATSPWGSTDHKIKVGGLIVAEDARTCGGGGGRHGRRRAPGARREQRLPQRRGGDERRCGPSRRPPARRDCGGSRSRSRPTTSAGHARLRRSAATPHRDR